MIKYIVTLLATVLLGTSMAQNLDWPLPGWRQGMIHTADWTQNFAQSNGSIACEKDTTVGGTTYKLMRSSFFQDFLVRKDNGKIYRTGDLTAFSEYLVYDFNVVVGDTVEISWPFVMTAVVDSVGQYNLPNGTLGKYVHFNSGDEWIEGVGNLNGGFFNYQDFEGGYDTHVCTYDSDAVQLYFNPGSNNDCDSLLNSVGFTEVLEFGVQKGSFFPNPITSELRWNMDIDQPSCLRIYSVFGELIKSAEIEPYENIFELDNLTAGTYIVEITSNSNTYTAIVFKE